MDPHGSRAGATTDGRQRVSGGLWRLTGRLLHFPEVSTRDGVERPVRTGGCLASRGVWHWSGYPVGLREMSTRDGGIRRGRAGWL